MTDEIGTPVNIPATPATPDVGNQIRQIFCTVNDLVDDMDAVGGDEERLYQAVKEASDVVQKEIGWFIPVSETIKMRGNGRALLFVPPILQVTGNIPNGDTIILTSADYMMLPENKNWANGPYSMIELQPDAQMMYWDCYRPDSVQIPALRGLYSETEDTLTTLDGTINASVTELAVHDGAKVSPGMTLKIGDEQILVTGWGSPTSATQLSAGIDASASIISVDDGTKILDGEKVRIGFEQIKVREVQSNQFDGLRSWNRTRAVTHATAAAVSVYRTVKVEREINGTVAAIHADGAGISRYKVPDDILFLTKQIATLMINKAKGGYAGKTGNSELGEVYYHDAFPRYEMERIKKLYTIYTG